MGAPLLGHRQVCWNCTDIGNIRNRRCCTIPRCGGTVNTFHRRLALPSVVTELPCRARAAVGTKGWINPTLPIGTLLRSTRTLWPARSGCFAAISLGSLLLVTLQRPTHRLTRGLSVICSSVRAAHRPRVTLSVRCTSRVAIAAVSNANTTATVVGGVTALLHGAVCGARRCTDATGHLHRATTSPNRVGRALSRPTYAVCRKQELRAV